MHTFLFVIVSCDCFAFVTIYCVIRCGALETPKLLMLSGIGPRSMLSEHGIDTVIANDAVGQNLIDRKQVAVGIPMLKSLTGDTTSIHDSAALSDEYWTSFVHKRAAAWGDLAEGLTGVSPVSRTELCRRAVLGRLLIYGEGAVDPQLLEMMILTVAQRRPRARGNVRSAPS